MELIYCREKPMKSSQKSDTIKQTQINPIPPPKDHYDTNNSKQHNNHNTNPPKPVHQPSLGTIYSGSRLTYGTHNLRIL